LRVSAFTTRFLRNLAIDLQSIIEILEERKFTVDTSKTRMENLNWSWNERTSIHQKALLQPRRILLPRARRTTLTLYGVYIQTEVKGTPVKKSAEETSLLQRRRKVEICQRHGDQLCTLSSVFLSLFLSFSFSSLRSYRFIFLLLFRSSYFSLSCFNCFLVLALSPLF
jgi:hypothetical protein